MDKMLHEPREPMGGSDGEPELREFRQHRLQRCPYQQNLRIFCGETDCTRAGCPIWMRESGLGLTKPY